jgi:hypothetical protein
LKSAGFTTFLTIRNTSEITLTVSVLFYGPTFSTPFSKAVTLSGGALTILDAGDSAATAYRAGRHRFRDRRRFEREAGHVEKTSGNFDRESAHGLRVRRSRGRTTLLTAATSRFGAPSSTASAVLKTIRPSSALLSTTTTATPAVASSGNQLIFVNFRIFTILVRRLGSTTWDVTTTRSNGAGIDTSVHGERRDDLRHRLGRRDRRERLAGSMEFRARTPTGSRG